MVISALRRISVRQTRQRSFPILVSSQRRFLSAENEVSKREIIDTRFVEVR